MDTFVKGGNEMWKMPAKEHDYMSESAVLASN